jgi:hypothetical protein
LANALAGAADLIAIGGRAEPPRFGIYAPGFIKMLDHKAPPSIVIEDTIPCTIDFKALEPGPLPQGLSRRPFESGDVPFD